MYMAVFIWPGQLDRGAWRTTAPSTAHSIMDWFHVALYVWNEVCVFEVFAVPSLP